MKSPTKILTINNGGKCEKIQFFPKLTDEFQITEIKFESLNRRTITKEKEETDNNIYYDEYGQSFKRVKHISEKETFFIDKIDYKIIESTVTRIYSDGIAEVVDSIHIDRYPGNDNAFFKIRRDLKEFTYNENRQVSKIKTTNTFINKDDVSYMLYTSTKDLISSELKDDELVEKYKTITTTDKIDVITEKVFDKDYTPDYIRKEYIITDIFNNDTAHQLSHEIKNQYNKVVHSEKYTYVIDTNCHTSRMNRTLLDKNGKISKLIYEDYDDELFDKLTLYQELINVFDFKGDKKTAIIFKRKYSYDNDGDVIFIDQEKINHLKTKKSQQIFIY